MNFVALASLEKRGSMTMYKRSDLGADIYEVDREKDGIISVGVLNSECSKFTVSCPPGKVQQVLTIGPTDCDVEEIPSDTELAEMVWRNTDGD